MKTTIVFGHPTLNKEKNGFISKINKDLYESIKNKINITIIDLSKDYDIKKHQEILENSDKIILQFPVFWFSIPGLLKQWLDDFLEYGWAYGTKFALEGKILSLSVTTGQVEESYTKTGRVGKTIEELFVLFDVLCGYTKMIFSKNIFHIGNGNNITQKEIDHKLIEYQDFIKSQTLV